MSDEVRGPRPVRAIFQDVMPVKNQVPAWLARPEKPLPAPVKRQSVRAPKGESQLPPSQKRRESYRPAGSGRSPSAVAPDELFDERVKTASLAAAMGESWQPSPGGGGEHGFLAQALEEVRAAVVEFASSQAAALRALEPEILALIRLITERVLEREVASDRELAGRLVREGLASLDERSVVQIALGSAFEEEAAVLEAALEQDGVRAEVRIDPRLAAYACKLRGELGDVDESLETRLDAVLSALELDGHL